MELQRAVRGRRMTRRFEPTPIEPSVLRQVLDLARFAPTAGHTQGVDLLALVDDDDRAAYWRATTSGAPPDAWLRGVQTAPVLVVVTSHPQGYLDRYAEPDKGWTDRDPGRWPTPFWDTDAAMAAMVVLLGARDAGLGALWAGIPGHAHDAVRTAFGVPADRRLVGLLAIGHAAPSGRRSPSLARPRRTVDDVVHVGRW